jgi:glycosyltransferase involved in cell wall biosynthesis
MRIVIDATAANSGGKVYLTQLLPRLAALSDKHDYIVFHAGSLDEMRLPAALRIRFHRVSLPFERGFIGASIMKYFWRSFILPFYLLRLRPVIFFSNAGLVPRFRRADLKTVLALHNSMPLRADLIGEERSFLRRWRLLSLRRMMRRSLREADGSIVFSRDSKQRIVDLFDDLREMPSVVHHGIEWGADERQCAGAGRCVHRFGILDPYLLFVSQFHRYKNVLCLLEAFSIFSAKFPKIKLVLVGEAADQAYWREIEAAIDRHGLRDRVIHLADSEREDLRCLYRHARAFVHPSMAETCSFPLLEALAMGTPIAAAAGSALPEIAGDAALYFNPESVEEMAAALDRLMCDESLRNDLGRRAIARAALFSWDKTARETLEVFEGVSRTGYSDQT